MGVIKSADVPASVSPFSMKDVEKQAVALLRQARQQADHLLAAAQAEGEVLKQKARIAGYRQGHEEGRAKGYAEGLADGQQKGLDERRAELGDLISALRNAAASINESRLKLQADGLNDVLSLAVAIAERVTKRMGILDPQTAIANVTDALKLVGHESDVRIAIHPSQKASLARALPQLKIAWPRMEHVDIVDDERLAPGGCRVYTARGEVDGDLDQQLQRIVTDLLPDSKEAT